MLDQLQNLTVTDPWVVAVVLVVLAGIGLKRKEIMDAVLADWEFLAVGGAGAYIGWSYDVAGLLEVIPLI